MNEQELAALDFCHLTTTGRRTGHPHTIEIWFALDDDHVYLLSGGGDASDWVRNLRANPTVGLLEKYSTRYEGDLAEWGRTSLPVAIDLPE